MNTPEYVFIPKKDPTHTTVVDVFVGETLVAQVGLGILLGYPSVYLYGKKPTVYALLTVDDTARIHSVLYKFSQWFLQVNHQPLDRYYIGTIRNLFKGTTSLFLIDQHVLGCISPMYSAGGTAYDMQAHPDGKPTDRYYVSVLLENTPREHEGYLEQLLCKAYANVAYLEHKKQTEGRTCNDQPAQRV
jgi:hypothetical protein